MSEFKMTDKNDETLIVGAIYCVPQKTEKFQLRQDETGQFYLMEILSNQDFALDDFLANDDGDIFLDIYREGK